MAIRCTMLTLLAAILFGVIACKPAGPPIYALVRLRHETRVEMLTIMKTYGEGACEAAIAEFLSGVWEDKEAMEGWRETERDCRDVLKPLYVKIFNDEPVHATYLKFTVGTQYEGRIVLFGISSSQAMPVCEEMAGSISSSFTTRAKCIQGTEG